MKVIMVGPNYKKVKGGMSTVVQGYLRNEFLNNVELIFISTYEEKSKVKKMLLAIKAYIKIIWLLTRDKIDIVHINMAAGASFYRKSIIVLLGKIFNSKIIIHMHGGAFQKFYLNTNDKIAKKYIHYTFSKCEKVIVLSKEWKVFFKENNFKNNIEVLHNGVVISKENKYNCKNTDLIFIGKICENKGVYDLLKCIRELKEEIPNIKLKIAGIGEEEKLRKKILDYKIEDNIELLGWINAETMRNVFNNIGILILPSYHEGLPMCILEAMSFGIPSIATKVGGIPTLIEHEKEGLLFEAGNNKELKDCIKKLIENSDLRDKMSNNSYKKCKKEFDINTINDKLTRVLIM